MGRGLRGGQLGHGGFELVGFALVFKPGGLIDQELRGLVLHHQVGDLGLYHLMTGQGLAKLLALVGVVHSQSQGSAGNAQRARRATYARVAKLPHAHLEAVVQFA